MHERRPESQPRPEVTGDAVIALAKAGLVEDVNWAVTQIPGITIAEAIPIQSTANRARSGQLYAEALVYDSMTMLSDNALWRERMSRRADELRANGRAHLEEAIRIEEINRQGYESMQSPRHKNIVLS